MPPTLVKQLAYHCVPACLESIAKDYGKNIGQSEIAKNYPQVFSNGTLTDSSKLTEAVEGLGIGGPVSALDFKDLNQIYELSKEHEILIIWTKVTSHCTRFCSYDPTLQQITVMDPTEDVLQSYNLDKLNQIVPKLFYFKKIKMP